MMKTAKMTKRMSTLAAMLMVASAAVAGCKKKDATPAAGDKAAATAVEKTAAPKSDLPSTKPNGPGIMSDRALAAIPADSDIIIGANLQKLRNAPLLAAYLDTLPKQMPGMEFDIKAQCGFDPLSALGSVVVAVNSTTKRVYAIVGGIAKSDILKCIDKAKPSITAGGATLAIDGDNIIISHAPAAAGATDDSKKGGVAMSFIDDHTALLIGDDDPVDAASLKAMTTAKTGAGLSGAPDFVNMIKSVDTGVGVWLLVNGSSPAMAQLPIKAKYVFGSVDASDKLAFDIRIRMGSPSEATSFVSGMGSQIGQLKQMSLAEVATVAVDGSDAHVSVSMSKAQIDQLVGMFKGMAGGLMKGAQGTP